MFIIIAIPPCVCNLLLLPSQKAIKSTEEVITAKMTSMLFQEWPIKTKIPDTTKLMAAIMHKTPAIDFFVCRLKMFASNFELSGQIKPFSNSK